MGCGNWLRRGCVTADGFENLRSLVDPKRRRGEGRGRHARPRHAAGRWALLRTGDPVANPEAFANQMLLRWGVVFRDLLGRETLAPAWRDLLVTLRRWKRAAKCAADGLWQASPGTVPRPEAVDLLRVVRRSEKQDTLLEVAPSDPLHLTGIILPREPEVATEPYVEAEFSAVK